MYLTQNALGDIQQEAAKTKPKTGRLTNKQKQHMAAAAVAQAMASGTSAGQTGGWGTGWAKPTDSTAAATPATDGKAQE